MVFCMVYCMTVYNIALKFGGLNNLVFLLALKEMWLEYVVVFCLIYFVITNTAKKLALCVQVFFVGPFVRLVFRRIFSN